MALTEEAQYQNKPTENGPNASKQDKVDCLDIEWDC